MNFNEYMARMAREVDRDYRFSQRAGTGSRWCACGIWCCSLAGQPGHPSPERRGVSLDPRGGPGPLLNVWVGPAGEKP